MGLAAATSIDRDRRGLGYLIGGRLVLAGLSLGLAVAIDRMEGGSSQSGIWGVYWTVIAAFVATIVSASMIHRTSNPARFATAQVGIDVTIVTALVYFSGGGESFFTFLYALVVLYGALFLDRGGVALSCALAVGGYGLVLFGVELGLLPGSSSEDGGRPLALLVAYWGFYAGALVVLGMLANTLSAELRATGAALDRRTHDLRRLRDLHLRTVESIESGLLTTDEAGRVTSFNPEAERITGIGAAEAAGRALDDVIPGASEIVAASATGRWEDSGVGRARVPYRNVRGEELFLGLGASGLNDEEGQQVGHVVIFQDVTGVVGMEHELRRSERLAAVGEMAARMAHEIRNPLASISGSVQILQSGPEAPGGDPEHARLMGIVVREVDRLNVLISDFLRYSRPSPTKPERVDLSALVADVAEMAQSQTGEGAAETELALDDAVCVIGDPSQLEAIVWNLWNNAIESMTDQSSERRLTVRVYRSEDEAFRVQSPPQVPDPTGRNEDDGGIDPASRAGWSAVLEVEDSGPGLTPEVEEQIFEPFFTTKDDGTGLGLSTVQRLVEQHGGAITVTSRAGEGTCFRVILAGAEAV
ncbi:MAG: ATP-binding protein [bacterium]|nr:ATP-binding protein [bacterium]